MINKFQGGVSITAKEAQDKLFRAQKEYDETIKSIYPNGSRWFCTHGTKGEYLVTVVGYDSFHGIAVENCKTGKRKHVPWSSLKI